jgi:glycosyltransferase involved in cell wall biosynthesis
LPNKLFEYIAVGVAPVVSALPEAESAVRELGVGWTVDPSDPESIARGIEEALLARGPDLDGRLAAAAARVSWATESRILTDLYAEIARASASHT